MSHTSLRLNFWGKWWWRNMSGWWPQISTSNFFYQKMWCTNFWCEMLEFSHFENGGICWVELKIRKLGKLLSWKSWLWVGSGLKSKNLSPEQKIAILSPKLTPAYFLKNGRADGKICIWLKFWMSLKILGKGSHRLKMLFLWALYKGLKENASRYLNVGIWRKSIFAGGRGNCKFNESDFQPEAADLNI